MVGRRLYVTPHIGRRERSLEKRFATQVAESARQSARPVEAPITEGKVRDIAEPGFPLWDSIDTLQLRNHRITIAYHDLSVQLASLLAGGSSDVRDANWFTFATWASRTVGLTIEQDPPPKRGDASWTRRSWLASWLAALAQRVTRSNHGAIFRSLAAGNRFVFLEMGVITCQFIVRFTGSQAAREDEWNAYCDDLRQTLDELRQLDPSWIPTAAPRADELRRGLRCYYDAIFEKDAEEKAQLILSGNILTVAYEQRRVDGYVAASLSLFPRRSMRHLVQRGSGAFKVWYRRLSSRAYARFVTRFWLMLQMPDGVVKVGRPLRQERGTALFPPALSAPTEPLLQALLNRYDQSDGRDRKRRAGNWSKYDDRMNCAVNLMRSRQQQDGLISRSPYDVEATRDFLSGSDQKKSHVT